MKGLTRCMAVVTAMALTVTGITVGGSEAKAKVSLNKKSLKLTVGKKANLKVKNAKKAKLTWKSSKKKVATVSKKGVVTAKKAGKTTISVKVKGKGINKMLKCAVTVVAKTPNKPDAPKATDVPKTPDAPKATPEPTPFVPTTTFAPQTENYSYFDDFSYGYGSAVVVYKKGEKTPLQPKKVPGAEARNNINDNIFATRLNNGLFDDKITLAQPIQFTTADGVVHEIGSAVTDYNFWADPTCINNEKVDGKLYVYGTTDTPEYSSETGKLTRNLFHNKSLTVASTSDMVNWTDEGTVDASNLTNETSTSTNKVERGWGGLQSWAPSGMKYDGDGDGKDEYYIVYTNGGVVGYIKSDSPTGPWTDDLGEPLFTHDSPNCSEDQVPWVFDPAVLVDDKGDVYVYFGGGNRNAARVCKMKFEKGTGKMSPDGDPKPVGNYYHFEDNEINQINGKYYYSYCSDQGVEKLEYKLTRGSIAAYVSSDPMNIAFDPEEKEDVKFTDDDGVYHHFLSSILPNPASKFGDVHNNHHHMQDYKGHNYMFYHTSILPNTLFGAYQQYRNVHVDEISIDKDTDEIDAKLTYEGPSQIENFNPYGKIINATTAARSAGVGTKRDDIMVKETKNGSPMVLNDIDTGDWTLIKGVDFGEKGLKSMGMEYLAETEMGRVEVFIDSPTDVNNKIGTIDFYQPTNGKYAKVQSDVTKEVKGKHDLYFVFRGEKYNVASWMFTEK